MACPYFMPVARLEGGNWPHPARLPLGCGWSGRCTAQGHEGEIPPQDVLEAFCNLGYASRCAWAPAERRWDAVRFSLAAPLGAGGDEAGNGSSDHGRMKAQVLRLIYVCEREHRPVEQGELRFHLQSGDWVPRHPDARIQKMAECFLELYLKKKA